MTARKVIVHAQRRVYDGYFKLDEAVVSYERLDGQGMVERATRLVFERGDSAAALVHDIERDVVILAEQFRWPTHGKPGGGWLQELVAGAVEEGETPEHCIRRELAEEIGLNPGALQPMLTIFPSPGGSSERVFLFYAPVRAPAAPPQGEATPDEDVRAVEIPAQDFITGCAAGAWADAKTAIAGLWLAARR